jgi:hypothetical protein
MGYATNARIYVGIVLNASVFKKKETRKRGRETFPKLDQVQNHGEFEDVVEKAFDELGVKLHIFDMTRYFGNDDSETKEQSIWSRDFAITCKKPLMDTGFKGDSVQACVTDFVSLKQLQKEMLSCRPDIDKLLSWLGLDPKGYESSVIMYHIGG